MEFAPNHLYNGFKLIEKREIPDINSTGYYFIHEKTGAELMHLANDDENKLFAAAFKTIPNDSSGVAHILEHSVLCGSRKYPSKEPFVELLKGSLNTFLNAFTFPDKTMYPVASTNAKDFRNLMDVYLDAVFYPNLHKVPDIFFQEGWHYELDAADAELQYKGVVYNEMLGAFSSPEQVMWRRSKELLFPDTAYRNESGGDPEVIPTLTYEAFTAFHKRFYHPSNTRIILYGDGDLNEYLSFLDTEYFSHFDKQETDTEIALQPPFQTAIDKELNYAVSAGESIVDKAWLSMNWVAGITTDLETSLGMEILMDILMGTAAAPLKNALLAANLGKDVYGSYESGILQPMLSIVVKHSDIQRKNEFSNLVYETLNQLVRDGIDPRLIEAAVNIREFKLREADFGGYPKGLVYGMAAMEGWLHGSNPFNLIEFEEPISKIRTAAKHRYFESLIETYILNNAHQLNLHLLPEPGLAERRADVLHNQLQDYKKTLSEAEVNAIVAQTQQLKERQAAPDTKEALESIPVLTLNDVDKKARTYPILERSYQGIQVLHADLFTNKIAYVDIHFRLPALTENEIQHLGLLIALLGKVDTSTLDYKELSNEMLIHTGGIGYGIETFINTRQYHDYSPMFHISSRALVHKTPDVQRLIYDVLFSSRFDNRQRVREILRELKSGHEMGLMNSGHSVAAGRMASYYSQAAYFNEILSGFDFYLFITELENDYDKRFEALSQQLDSLLKKIVNRNAMTLSITAESAHYDEVMMNFAPLADRIPAFQSDMRFPEFNLIRKNEAIAIPGNVQYVVKGANFRDLGFQYHGSMRVAKNVIGLDYLWNKVRVMGGAYGAFSNFARTGGMFFGSYRDPNLTETLDIYDSVGQYLSNFDAGEREMSKYILGTVSQMDSPLSPASKGRTAVSLWFSGFTSEDIQKEREEVLTATQHSIRQLADMVTRLMEQNLYCVVGSEGKLEKASHLFTETIPAFK